MTNNNNYNTTMTKQQHNKTGPILQICPQTANKKDGLSIIYYLLEALPPNFFFQEWWGKDVVDAYVISEKQN